MKYQLLVFCLPAALTVGCMPPEAGHGMVGSGGTGSELATGGSGGSGGSMQATGGSGVEAPAALPELGCTEEETAFAKGLGERGGGFQSLRLGNEPTDATVVEADSTFLRLELASGEQGTFDWPSPFPLEIPEGSRVRIGWRGKWQVLASDHGALAVLSSSDLGSVDASFPEGGALDAMLATHCRFPLEGSGCEGAPAHAELQSVVAGFRPLGRFGGTVVVRPGRMSLAAGWTFENHGAVHIPGGPDDGDCVVESGHSALVTAYTPYAEAAPF